MAADQEKNTEEFGSAGGSVRPLPIDWQLQHLVDLANSKGLEAGLTLTVKGTIITGTLIGGGKYFELFAELIGAGWPGTAEEKEAIRSAFAQPAKLYEEPEQLLTSYIHLKNAKIVYSSNFVPSSGMLWRGRLDEISGFSLGLLS